MLLPCCMMSFVLGPFISFFRLYDPMIITVVRHSSHWGGSPQNRLGDEWTCGTTLASAYVLRHLSAAWLQLQMKERKSEWK